VSAGADIEEAAIAGFEGLRPGARVVAAMSGGVDSAVAAALATQAGFDVVGVTLQLYDHGAATRKGSCCAGQDIYDARRVADRLSIPHYVLDYERRFRNAVMEDFANSYARGETPIPCVRCNQRIKFRDLLATARELGAEALVTGHYVRRTETPAGPALHKAADERRDQSYFLFATTPAQLAQLRFPLGGLPKSRTRTLAGALGLGVAEKPDSQDICFVPEGRYADVVARLRPDAAEPGDIRHEDGRLLGRHEGVINFTVGQRRGLGVAAAEPLYVLRLDAAAKEVVVGSKAALAATGARLREINWLAEPGELGDSEVIEVKVRSTTPAVAASVSPEGHVRFAEAQLGVAPGQACVFYRGSRLLGGGFIAGVEAAQGSVRGVA
jgi:tRNA-uridine 2-sulfurtransferase